VPTNAQAVYRPDQTPCQSPVTRISGVRADSTDADMYVICITDPANFSASTVGLAGFDTQLWLFRCDGTGVVHNDDSGGAQSRIDNSTGCLNGLQAGTYLLAITGYNQDPVDSGGNLLWNNSPFGAVRCPDGPGAANPMVGWTGSGGSGNYGIALTGAYFVAQGGCEGGPGQCEGDANRDGRVDDADLLIVLFQFGQSGFGLQGDVDNNGTVDDADLLIVLFKLRLRFVSLTCGLLPKGEARLYLSAAIASTLCGFSSALRSPVGSPKYAARMTRRIILALRVLGKSGTA
jgi:hypothetical protein